ncbi:hypothetical protein [Shewanella algae]
MDIIEMKIVAVIVFSSLFLAILLALFPRLVDFFFGDDADK